MYHIDLCHKKGIALLLLLLSKQGLCEEIIIIRLVEAFRIIRIRANSSLAGAYFLLYISRSRGWCFTKHMQFRFSMHGYSTVSVMKLNQMIDQ